MTSATAQKNCDLEAGDACLGTLRDSTAFKDDAAILRQRMNEDGYLFIRGVQKRKTVEAARRTVLEYLDRDGNIDRDRPLIDGVKSATAKPDLYLGGRTEITHTPAVLELTESPEIMNFFQHLMDEAPLTISYKWLRAVGSGAATPPHYDIVYMGRGSQKLYTCWTALGDIPLEQGPLAVLRGSHALESYRKIRDTYGKADVDRDNISSFFSHDPREIVSRYGGEWQTSDFKMGDVLIFTMFTMHASIRNLTNRYRLSCDTRFQPASEPLDERWIGRSPLGNYAWRKSPVIPTEVSRKEWGV